MLRALVARIMAEHTDTPADRIAGLFAQEIGYATPKIDVRGAVFGGAGRILLVREAMDGGRWTLPGGWADVNQTLSECVVREVREESGYIARVQKLVAVWDRTRQGHPPGAFSMAKVFFTCALEGGAPANSLETSGVGWFLEEALPADLSLGRTLPHQLHRMFAHWREPWLPAEYD